MVADSRALDHLAVGQHHVAGHELRPERIGFHARANGLHPFEILGRWELFLANPADDAMSIDDLLGELLCRASGDDGGIVAGRFLVELDRGVVVGKAVARSANDDFLVGRKG